MAVNVRLRRIGKTPKKRPFFRFSVIEETRNRDGKCLEELGYYNPVTGTVSLKKERYDYWVGKGARVSDAVKRLAKKSK